MFKLFVWEIGTEAECEYSGIAHKTEAEAIEERKRAEHEAKISGQRLFFYIKEV